MLKLCFCLSLILAKMYSVQRNVTDVILILWYQLSTMGSAYNQTEGQILRWHWQLKSVWAPTAPMPVLSFTD